MYVLRLRLLVSAGMWEQVGPALHTAEDALELAYSCWMEAEKEGVCDGGAGFVGEGLEERACMYVSPYRC